MSESTVTGRLTEVERLPSSPSGNPRFRLTVGGKEYPTQVNASVSYEVENFRIGREVTLTLSRAGHVTDITEGGPA